MWEALYYIYKKWTSVMTHSLEFTCWKNDQPLEIQLEPEAILFTANPGDTLKFVPEQPTSKFRWTIRLDDNSKAVQVFPDPPDGYGNVQVYRNDQLIWQTT